MNQRSILVTLAICALMSVQALAAPLAATLREEGVKPADAGRFEGSVRQAVTSYKSKVGKLSADSSLPAPISAVLDDLSGLTSKYHLRGDQTIELMACVMEQVDSKFAQATPSLEPLKGLMVRYKVPGPELYVFMLPNLKKGLQQHMSGHHLPGQSGMAELGEAVSFANRYNIPTGQFLSALQNFRAAVKSAGH